MNILTNILNILDHTKFVKTRRILEYYKRQKAVKIM